MSDKNNPEVKSENRQFSRFFYNRITYLGVFLAVIVFVIEILLFCIDFFAHKQNVYLGIFTYVILPPFLILGLALIPIGALRMRRRVINGLQDGTPKTLFVDPSIPSHRNAIFIFIVGTSILLIMTAIGSYKAFQYTESVHFCGITCHTVMEPQYTAYTRSPHARVKCVECHIGEGADWYVRAKLSGARQVVKTITNEYPRPVPSPIKNLRPAKETCLECHWPGKTYSSFELRRTYYSSSQAQQPKWLMRMLVHVGTAKGGDQGIHNHMYNDNEIYFVAEDAQRQKISWIKSIDKNGKPVIFTSGDSPYKDKEPPPEIVRKMDCIDCHNRPTHHFESPFELANQALLTKKIDETIPNIKQKILDVLSKEYSSREEAASSIRGKLLKDYQNDLGESFGQYQSKIEQAIEEVVSIYQSNFFPDMKVRWDTYPDNIGHLNSPGCFRCHDGEHKSASGVIISRDCNICHTIIEQGAPHELEKNTEGLEFKHPFEDDGLWQEMNCSDCHTGGAN